MSQPTVEYQVLARRWRPRRFSELVGQDVVARTLRNAVAQGMLSHAYLLTGIRGVGKTTIARLLAMAVNCTGEAQDGEPCNHCEACQDIAHGNSLDVHEMDAASHTSVDDVRDILETLRYPPSIRRWRVFIIDEAHMLSRSAFNALLKTLEEPPPRVMFILATTDIERLPITVRSRCQRFDLRRLSVAEITRQLTRVFAEEGIMAETAAIEILARLADGSMRDALSLAERMRAFSQETIRAEDVREALGLIDTEIPRRLTDAIIQGDAARALHEIRQATEHGHLPSALLNELASLWHKLACAHVDQQFLSQEQDEQAREWMLEAMRQWPHAILDLHYQVLLRGLEDIARIDAQCAMEMIVLRLCHLRGLLAREDPLQTMDKGEKKNTGNAPPPRLDESKKENANATDPGLAYGRKYDDWNSAVQAYGEIEPALAALLEEIVCTRFDQKVRLSLREHQQRAISMRARADFERWLGRPIIWDDEHHEESAQSIAEQRKAEQQAEQSRLWEHARKDPHIQGLVKALDASLTDVRPAGMAPQEEESPR